MSPDKIPEKKTNPFFAVGVIFIAVGVAMMFSGNRNGGITFLILGMAFLAGKASARAGGKQAKPPRGFPSEPEIRESQAASERKLRGEALAPDRGEELSGRPAPRAPARGPAARMNANELEQRREKLLGLLDSGIIDRDEYRDRMKKLRP